MKGNFFKRIIAFLGLSLAVLTLGACQSTGHDARVIFTESAVQLFDVTEGGVTRQKARSVLTVENNTIFNTKTWSLLLGINYTNPKTGEAVFSEFYNPSVDCVVAHGTIASVYSEVYVDTIPFLKEVGVERVNNVSILKNSSLLGSNYVTGCQTYYNVWDTYLAWWIVMICIVAVAWICYACVIFKRGLIKSDLGDVFSKHMGTIMITFGFMFLLCLFPLIVGSWFVTIILLLALLAVVVGFGIMTGLRALAMKK